MDTDPTTEASYVTSTLGNPIPFDLITTAITELATEFTKLIQVGLKTSSITNQATEFLKPEKLTPFLQEHKSAILIAALWLARSWLYILLPFPSFTILPAFLLTLVSLILTTSPRTLTGLAHYAYSEISPSITSLTKKTLPAWLPRVIPIVLLFPFSRAIGLLFALAVWEIVGKYRDGLTRLTEEADQAIHRAVSAAEKASEHVREMKGLEMQAMQLAAVTPRMTVAVATAVKKEVEGMVQEVELLGGKVDKVRKLAEKAKAAAEEGNLEMIEEMVVNVGTLVERVVQGEKKVRDKVEEVREQLWGLSLGQYSS